ncbi:serine hydrolase [Verticiella sediminum]|uniref:Serine hydrolase n=2 Tax=Verticiella sediminum TaxID=1247510 RepID=A0A556AE57_9BURK|nr:serine hydrolase [Verticiella sediminum]
MRQAVFAALIGFCLCLTPAAAALPDWPHRLAKALDAIDAHGAAQVGVYVLDLQDGVAVSRQADERWYLASMVKVPVAAAVLQGVARGDFSLASELTLRPEDYVDGAGRTNRYAPGQALSVQFLMEQMLIHSDNTASDMLIRLVGIDRVNALVHELWPAGVGRITTLADVRRAIYSEITPEARQLAGRDFLRIRAQPTDDARLGEMFRILELLPVANMPTLNQAYANYYATGLNAGRLDAFGRMFAVLEDPAFLPPAQRRWLLEIMAQVRTGDRRIKAGLPADVVFAHKTGTQRARFCDGGIARHVKDASRALVIVACVAGDGSLQRSERVLRDVGSAVADSGYFSERGR